MRNIIAGQYDDPARLLARIYQHACVEASSLGARVEQLCVLVSEFHLLQEDIETFPDGEIIVDGEGGLCLVSFIGGLTHVKQRLTELGEEAWG